MTAAVSTPSPSRPIGFLLVLAVAAACYIWLIVSITAPPGGNGEAIMAQGFQALFVTFFLWIALALLLFIGGAMGGMPGWAALLAVVVHPLSGVGAFLAIDMISRHAVWALVFPGLLPPLIAFYAIWARLPRLRAALPAGTTSIAAWAAILVLSLLPFPISYWGPGTFGQ